MAARILQNAMRLRCLRASAEIRLPPAQQRSYAIAMSSAVVNCGDALLLSPQAGIRSNVPIAKSYATKKTEYKERAAGVEIILKRLATQYEASGYVSAEILQQLLQQLETEPTHYNKYLTSEQAKFLLESCCPQLMPTLAAEQRLQYFQRFWRYLESNKKLTKEHYLLQLQILKQNRLALNDFKLYIAEGKEKYGLTEQELYDELLDVACSAGNMRQATDILLAMRNNNKALTERNFNSLLLGNARNKDINEMKSVLNGMQAAGMSSSMDTQTALALGYLDNECWLETLEILDKFKGQFEVGQLVELLRASLSVSMDKTVLQRLLEECPKAYLMGNDMPVALRNLCIELLHQGKLDEVLYIIEILPTPQHTEHMSTDTYGMYLLQELVNLNTHSTKVLEFAQLLKDSGKNTRALHLAAEIAMRRSPPLGLPYLECLSKEETLRPHYFWPLMMYNFRRHGENGIIRTLKIMAQYDLCSDPETFKEYVLPRLSLTLEQPQRALQMFDNIGVKTNLVMTPIIGNMLMQQQIKETLSLLEAYPTKLQINELIQPLVSLAVHMRATKHYQQFAELVAAIMRKTDNRQLDYVGLLLQGMLAPQSRLRNDLNSVQRFVSEMHKLGLTISSATREQLITTLKTCFKDDTGLTTTVTLLERMCNRTLTPLGNQQDASQQSSSSFVKHPRDMTLEELEFHLIELESKRMNARGVLRRILQLCVRENKLERALQVKEKCDQLKVTQSPGMLASIMDLYIKLQDLPNAEQSFKNLRINYPAFQIDEHKHIDYAALLVQAQRYDEAIKMLNQRAESQKVNGGEYVVKNVWQLLVNVAQYAAKVEPALPADENLTRNTYQQLQMLGYCRTNNTVLGPIVREWLLRGDLPAAVDELRQLAKQYKHTPLQYELISLLVRLGNNDAATQQQFPTITDEHAQSLLKEVTQIVSSVHGAVNMNSSLLLAFAESGTDKQLRRLIMNPEFRINEEQLLKNCEHLSAEGAVVTLLRLARGVRGLNRLIDEQNIYNMLLNNFIKTNNHAAALQLYERLEADDELKVSQVFLKNIVNLLKMNNLIIPSNIALRAHVI